ncbi:hypothetical protein PI124_g23622 [Phytophthora idaei]|nr:hypothetical protein PI125_g25770 [Phytophthora idaei]KAG3231285.1 hypothetical protein PI124_g23622 [Phytophthora idaei]
MWLKNGKTVDDVFYLLRLDISFSPNALLNMWVSYMNAIITENPRKTSSLFSSLETRFSDRPLLEILETAKKYPKMESAARQLQTKTIDGIVASGKSPTETFKLLRLDNVGDGILSSPLFQTWKNYVEVFNKKRPNHQESWFDPTTFRFLSKV